MLQHLKKKNNSLDDDEIESERTRKMIEWTKQMTEALSTFSGISVDDFDQESFVVRTPYVCFRVRFALETLRLVDVEIIAPQSPRSNNTSDSMISSEKISRATVRDGDVGHIVLEAVKRNDICFLTRELQAFAQNRTALFAEINALRQRYPLNFVKDELVVTLPAGVVVTLCIRHDYPQSYSPLELIALDGFSGWRNSDMTRLREIGENALKTGQASTITELLDFISLSLSSRTKKQ